MGQNGVVIFFINLNTFLRVNYTINHPVRVIIFQGGGGVMVGGSITGGVNVAAGSEVFVGGGA